MGHWLVSQDRFKTLLLLTLILQTLLHIYLGLEWYEMADIEHPVWKRNMSRSISHYISPSGGPLIQPPDLCTPTTKNHGLLIVVCTKAENLVERTTIRETYGLRNVLTRKRVTLFFMLGRSLNATVERAVKAEAKRHQDIIQDDFVDSYFNLTLKTFALLKVLRNCSKKHFYLMKIDDDVHIHLDNILNKLNRSSKENLLLGRVNTKERRARKDVDVTWYSPHYMYPSRYYPKFLAGPLYIMSSDVVEKLFRVALETPIFHLEDVFFTGICAEKAGVERVNHDYFLDSYTYSDICHWPKYFSGHSLPAYWIRSIHRSLPQIRLICGKLGLVFW